MAAEAASKKASQGMLNLLAAFLFAVFFV